MKSSILLGSIVVAVIANGCGILGNDDKKASFKNPVYANVYFEQPEPGFTPYGLIAINYNNPKEFKLLSSDSAAFSNIRLSPDGTMISYADHYATGGPAPWLGVYNTKTESRQLLIDKRYDAPLVGNSVVGVVWNKDNSGFYYTNPNQPFSGHKAVWYYDLETRKTTILKKNQPYAIYPHDLISSDTLIVFSNEFGALEYYLMDLNGEYIHKIENPFIDGINEGGVTKRGIFDLAWNDSLRLITAGYINGEEFEGYKIIVTDLEGTTFKEFTNGIYLNTHPRWTRDGNIIFTEQRNLTKPHIDSELKLLDPETGEITRFFSSREYPEITGIGNADQ